jgi:iron complex transport system substrate-binding protein
MENKAAGLADSGPYPGFAMISLEAILIANPDVIVTISPAPEPAPRLSETLAHIPPFAGLKAMQNGNVIEADVELFLQAPGPRIADAVEFLKESLAAKSD